MSFSHRVYKIKNMNENEYLYLVRMNDGQAISELIEYFRPMVTQIWADIFMRQTKNVLCEKEEFYSQADYLLYQCVFEYRQEARTTFRYFYRKCLKNKSYDIVRNYMRKKVYLDMSFKSLDQKVKEDSKLYYRDMCCVSGVNVNDETLQKIHIEYLKKEIIREFGIDAYHILELRLQGYTLDYLSERFYRSRSSIRNLIEKIKKWATAIDS